MSTSKPIRVTQIISLIDGRPPAFEWLVQRIDPELVEIRFLILNPGPSQLEDMARERGLVATRIEFSGKRDYPAAFSAVVRELRSSQTDVVHAHMLDATTLGMWAAARLRIGGRIYTRHHSVKHWQEHPHWVPVDLLNNLLATHVVAPSLNVQEVLTGREMVPRRKVEVIHHGFDLSYFAEVDETAVRLFKQRHNLVGSYPVIGAISRFEELKGVEYVLTAFRSVRARHPDARLVLANAVGVDRAKIDALIEEFPDGAVTTIRSHEPPALLYHSFDIFLHVPISRRVEAFGQTYVEALAAGVPSVFTHSGVAPEFIRDGEHATVVPYKDAEAIAQAVIDLVDSEERRAAYQEAGRRVVEDFAIDRHVRAMQGLYLKAARR